IPTRAIWEKDPRSSSALFRVILNGKAGYIDEAGRVVIEPQFDPSYMRPIGEGDFVEGVALVRRPGKNLEVIDERGNELDFTGFVLHEPFSDALNIAVHPDEKGNHRWALLDHAGHKVASPDVYWLNPFSEGLAAFAEKKGWGNRPFVPVLPFGHPRGYI